jgi:hypothetical protein
MSKNDVGCGLVHMGVFNGVALWEMYWKHKIIFYVKVDTTDPDLVIKVQSLPKLDEPAVILPTNGRAMMVLDTKSTGDGEADVEVIERVSSTSVQGYIYPRMQSMIMRLYVPGYADVKAS